MMLKKKWFGQRTALICISVLIAFYSFYHLGGLFGTNMQTYAAGLTEETRVVGGTGYFFRDETVLTASNRGVVDYRAENGIKVSQYQTLAYVHEKGGSEEQARLRMLDAKIALLKQGLDGSMAIVDPVELREELREEYVLLMGLLAEQNINGLSDRSDSFQSGLNRADALIHGKESVSYETLSALQKERADLLAKAGKAGDAKTAATTGYFYHNADGCEEWFTMAAASEESLTEESFYGLLSKMEDATPAEGAYGKLSQSSEWRLVLPVSVEESELFLVGQTYESVLGNGSAQIPLTLEYTKEAPEHEQVLLVFSGDRLPDGFSFTRALGVCMTVERAQGLYVPSHVMVRQDGKYGVYILRGSVVRFRYVEIVYRGSDFYLVKADLPRDEENRVYLQANDLIIVNGKNLFDGRVMD